MAIEINRESALQGFRLSAYVQPSNPKYDSHYFCDYFIGYSVREAERLLKDQIHAFYGLKKIR
jgi:hypothetical protein